MLRWPWPRSASAAGFPHRLRPGPAAAGPVPAGLAAAPVVPAPSPAWAGFRTALGSGLARGFAPSTKRSARTRALQGAIPVAWQNLGMLSQGAGGWSGSWSGGFQLAARSPVAYGAILEVASARGVAFKYNSPFDRLVRPDALRATSRLRAALSFVGSVKCEPWSMPTAQPVLRVATKDGAEAVGPLSTHSQPSVGRRSCDS